MYPRPADLALPYLVVPLHQSSTISKEMIVHIDSSVGLINGIERPKTRIKRSTYRTYRPKPTLSLTKPTSESNQERSSERWWLDEPGGGRSASPRPNGLLLRNYATCFRVAVKQVGGVTVTPCLGLGRL